jgi:arginase family enzyme
MMNRAAETESTRYGLYSSLRLADYAGASYLYDAEAEAGVVAIPTQRIGPTARRVLEVLTKANLQAQPQPLPTIERLLVIPSERCVLRELLAAGYLRPELHPTDQRLSGDDDWNLCDLGYLRPLTFFNVPVELDDEQADVGIAGVPLSTARSAKGTELGCHSLRLLSRQVGNWLDIHQSGVYSEIGVADQMPRILCRSVVLKDYGNIDCPGLSVRACFDRVAEFVDNLPTTSRFRPLFVGGDHAVTIPLVAALNRHTPEMGVLHLDAHDDLFYDPVGMFCHAAVVRELLLHADVPQVCSFGLRTYARVVQDHIRRLLDCSQVRARWHPFSAGETSRLLSHPQEFLRWLENLPSRPWYLTIDLDVLSAEAIESQIAQPRGHGLAWHQVYALLDLLFSQLDIVAVDLVEFNPNHRIGGASNSDHELMALLLLVIHHLATRSGSTDPNLGESALDQARQIKWSIS